MTVAPDLHARYQADLGLAAVADVAVSPPSAGVLASALPVSALAVGSVAAIASAAQRLCAAAGGEPSKVTVVGDRVAASFAGDRLLRVDGSAVAGFAPLSGFFRTRTGWVRTHANYAHHRARLLTLLGLGENADHAAVAAAIADHDAVDLEGRAARDGALIVAVRTEAQWLDTAAGRFAGAGPLVTSTVRPDGASTLPELSTDPLRPLAGVRVLDLTRVIAGPVATRDLALLGASVLRIDPPRESGSSAPEIETQHLDTGPGKASATLDVRSDHERFAALISSVDVVVCGYRPGSSVDQWVREHRPGGSIIGTVSAWGDRGPWSRRRGFDSLVQAASGIAEVCGTRDAPGALPVQALDHASGHLLAAGIVDALAQRQEGGIGRTVSVSLARTAAWLLAAGGRESGSAAAVLPSDENTVTHGSVRTARPPLPGHDDFPFPARPWGQDPVRFP